MESLVVEVIMDILSRVPTSDLSKLRCVCKRWNNVIKDPLFHRLHYSHCMSKLKLNEDRVLILKRSSELHMVDISDKLNPREIAIDLPPFPVLSDFEFVGSCNGFLCFRSRECPLPRFFIINPLTRQHLYACYYEWVILPQPCIVVGYSVMLWAFGFDKISKFFKVVTVVKYRAVDKNRVKYDQAQVIVYDLGSNGTINRRNIGVTTFYSDSTTACLFNGRLHWTYRADRSIKIVSFDLADEEFRLIPIPDLQGNVLDFDLIVLGGCLCIFRRLDVKTPKLQIWVMKEYGNKASWEKQFDTQPRLPRSLNSQVNFSQHGGLIILIGLGCVKDGELIVSKYCLRMGTPEEAILFSDSTYDEYKLLQLDRPPEGGKCIIHTLSLNYI